MEQDHRQGCFIVEGARADTDSSIAGQSIACREVVDLVVVVDCLMLSGSCAVLEFLDHSWSIFVSGIYISKCLHGIDEMGQNVYSATPSVSAKLCTRTLSTLAIDVERLVEPIGYWPMPRWRKWKVEVWLFFEETSRVSGEGCIIQYIYWMDSLAELSAIHRTMFTTGGLYSRLRLELSTWTWDYNEPAWQEEVHV